MKIGDKVSVRPETFGRGVREGTVIWIHPDKRFALVEFEVQTQGPKWKKQRRKIRLRECFPMLRKEK